MNESQVRRPPIRWKLRLLAVGAALAVAPVAGAQDAVPVPPECAAQAAERAPSGAVRDGPEVRALVVFVRFRDDVKGSEPWVPTNSTFRGWPYWRLDPTGDPVLDARGEPVPANFETLPPIAHAFLAPSRAAITDRDSTLSAYFYQQSRAGRDAPAQFLMWGDVLPTDGPRWDQGHPIVYVTKHDNAWYHRVRDTENLRGYGYLTKEVLDHLVNVQGVDLGHYNLNPEADDVVDQIFMIVRAERNRHPSGVSSLGRAMSGEGISGIPRGTGRGLWYPSPSGLRDPDLPDCVRVDWTFSGNYIWNQAGGNVHQPSFYARYGAHEYGHDLWNGLISSVHMHAVRNAVPAAEPEGVNQFGFLLMGTSVGKPNHHLQGTHAISAYERSLLGWVALDTLDETRYGVTLGDLYTSGEAAVLPIGHGDTERALFLSNRQLLSYFDSLKVGVGIKGEVYTDDFPLTGLIAHFRGRRDAKDCVQGRRPCVDLLPPDNALDADYVDDAYKPGVKTQLTPWTKPNVNGCNGDDDPYCQGLDLTWAAIDDIRYLGDADSTLVFDFYEDVRTAPIVYIRADSWMGARTDGTTFKSEVRVVDGATLTIEAGVEVEFAGGLVVEPGSAVVRETVTEQQE